MAIGRITGQMLSSTLNRDTTDLKFSTTGETNLLVLDASNDRIGVGVASPTVQFETSGSAIIGTDLTVTGNLTVNGSTTTINTTNLTVDDKNIELAHSLSGQSPTDSVADGGGIILKGDTDHTILWSNANNSWDFSENVSVATGLAYQINNVNVLDANNLTLENIQIAGNVITSASNADISLQPSGTGNVLIEGIQISGTVITGTDSTVISFGGNKLSGVGEPSGSSDVATKAYVDSVAGGTITLGDTASNSGSVDINGGQDLEFRSGDSITMTVSGNGVTASLNDNITVNQIGAKDSTSIRLTNATEINGALRTDTSLQIAGSIVIDGIVDEDNFSSNSDTALATQQSIKAYVDSQITATNSLTIGDDGSSEITLNLDDVLNVKGGNSITSSVAGDSLTFALDSNIAVNQIGALDSTAINITSPVYVSGALNTDTSLQIAGSTLVDGILDEDNFASNSDTKLATQQSIKAYVDAVAEGLHVHAPAKAVTTDSLTNLTSDTVVYNNGSSGVGATLTLSTALTTLDGYTLQNGDRIIVKDESNQAHNGVYTWATGGTVLTRATDMDTPVEAAGGDFMFVQEGTLFGDAGFVQTETVTTIGSDNFIFVQFSGAGQIVAGDGLAKSGNELSVNVDNSTIEINADTLRVKDAGITNVKLAESTITVVGDDSTGTAVSLGETFKIAGGESLNASVTADTLTINLDDNIAVNQIGAKDSTAISLTSNTQVDGTLQVSGVSTLIGNTTIAEDITIASGTITSTSGSISFGDENLTTTGNITGSNLTATGNVQVNGNLFVSGTTTSINTTNLEVQDPLIELSKNNSGGADIDAGILVQRGSAGNNAAFYWNEGDDKFKAVLTSSDATATSVTDSSVATIVANIESAGTSTFANITVNNVSANDSSAIDIGSPVYVSGALNTDTSLQIAGSTLINGILDEDNFASNSDTKLATQQSIKAYVDSVAGGTITLGDSASNAGSVNINGGQDLEFRSGDSITMTVSGNGVTASLNDNITVNQIGSKDSTAVSITSNTQVDGTLQVSGTSALVGNVTMSGTFTAATGSSVGNLTLANGSITDSSGAISFGDENLSTTGTITGATGSQFGNITLANGSITDSSGTITFDNENLTTTGNITGADIQATGNLQVDGNLTVSGTTTSVNSTNITVSDPMLILSETNSGGADVDSGIMIERGSAGNNAVFYWNEGDDRFKAVLSTSDGTTTNVTDSSYATLNIGGLVMSAESVVVTSILDEDNFASDSDTALATQQSIKAYVDTEVAGLSQTVKISDDASTVLTLDLKNDTLSLSGGNSITSSITGDTVTFDLNDDIAVNQIGAKDSSAVSITSPLQTSTIQASGNIVVNGGTVSAGSGSSFGDLTLGDGSITDASGTIDFGDEDLTTTGNITATGGTITANQFDVGTLSITDGQITDTDGTIGFNDINLDGIDQLTTSSIVTNVISSSASTSVVVNDGLQVDGSLDVGSNFTISNGTSIDAILDEDTMASDSATALATQQSIKAYVDTQIAASSVASLNDIGDVDAQSGDKLDGDILVVNDDSSNTFTLASQLTTGMRVPSGTTAQRPTIYAGIIRYNSQTGAYEGSTDGSTWNSFAMAGTAETLAKDVFSGNGGATYNFSNVSDPITGNGNGALGLIVYIDNVLQEPTQNYTVTGSAITFDSNVHSGARIVVIQGFDGGAGGGAGSGFQLVSNIDVDSAVEDIDSFSVNSYRAMHYHYVIENDDNSEYQTGQLHVIHDGTSAQVQEFGMLRTGNNDLITFSVDISGSTCRLRGSAQTPNSKFKAKRVPLEVQ